MISKILKKIRENCGYTQQQVADALNLERSTYAYYEVGKTVPDLKTIMNLAKIFNVSYIDLLEEEGKPYSVQFNDNHRYQNKNGKKQSEFIYELTKDEKRLISFYRILPEAQKQDLSDQICDCVLELAKTKK